MRGLASPAPFPPALPSRPAAPLAQAGKLCLAGHVCTLGSWLRAERAQGGFGLSLVQAAHGVSMAALAQPGSPAMPMLPPAECRQLGSCVPRPQPPRFAVNSLSSRDILNRYSDYRARGQLRVTHLEDTCPNNQPPQHVLTYVTAIIKSRSFFPPHFSKNN